MTLALLRQKRDFLLKDCDWTQLPDAPISNEKKEEWANYRQELRDLPNRNDLDLNNPQWPQEPQE